MTKKALLEKIFRLEAYIFELEAIIDSFRKNTKQYKPVTTVKELLLENNDTVVGSLYK